MGEDDGEDDIAVVDRAPPAGSGAAAASAAAAAPAKTTTPAKGAAPAKASLTNGVSPDRAAADIFTRREWAALPPAVPGGLRFGAVESFYNRPARHVIDARDDCFEAYRKHHEAAVADITARLDAAAREAEKWDALWTARLLSLRHGLADSPVVQG